MTTQDKKRLDSRRRYKEKRNAILLITPIEKCEHRNCNKDVIEDRLVRKYCSPKCARIEKQLRTSDSIRKNPKVFLCDLKECNTSWKEYVPNKKFCCPEHRIEYHQKSYDALVKREKRRIKDRAILLSSAVKTKCGYSGCIKTFDRIGRTKKFCSAICSDLNNNERRKDKRKENKQIYTNICLYRKCKKEFTTDLTFQVYCDGDCRDNETSAKRKVAPDVILERKKLRSSKNSTRKKDSKPISLTPKKQAPKPNKIVAKKVKKPKQYTLEDTAPRKTKNRIEMALPESVIEDSLFSPKKKYDDIVVRPCTDFERNAIDKFLKENR